MHEPFRISSGAVHEKEAILVRLWDGDAFGWGESSAMAGPFYSVDTPDSCEAQLVDEVLPALMGKSFASIAALEAFLDERPMSPFVRAAIEPAAVELLARKQGVSVRSLLGLPNRPIESGLAVGLYETTSELCDAIERYHGRDYKRVKIKIKRGYDVELVRAVRQRFGDIPLFVDANADYSVDDIPIFEELDQYGLMMFEQPMAKDDFEGLAALQRRVRTPVCIDESADNLESVQKAIALDACRIVNIKLQRVGGYHPALRIIAACEAAGIPVWMGTMPELGIGSAQALILASHRAFQFPTDVEPSDRWYVRDLLTPPLTLNNGTLDVVNGPGIGFQVNVEGRGCYSQTE